MIHTMKPEAQPTREERIVLALDQAHKNVSDALTELYALIRETNTVYLYSLTTEPLRDVLLELAEIANRFDNQTESENER